MSANHSAIESAFHPATRAGATPPGAFLSVVTFGALWGITEATLGYLLHLGGRVLGIPGLAGFLMFPIAAFFMYQAYRASGRPEAPLMASAVAAASKAASVALPTVSWLFVVNPSIAILAEGLALTLFLVVFPSVARTIDRSAPSVTSVASVAGGALGAAIFWRLLFLLAVLVLPVQKGILMKGPGALRSFVGVESLVNGMVIATAWLMSRRAREGHAAEGRAVKTWADRGSGNGRPDRKWLTAVAGRPLTAALLLAAAPATQMVMAAF